MAKAVGLDIGSRACKVAVLSGGPKGARLVRYVEKEYELGEAGALTPAVVLTTLKKALSEARAPKNSVSFAVPAEQCTLREITVPFTEDEQIKKVVKFEFEPHLHSAAIEDVVIDYVRTGAARTGARLLVFAATKDMLRSRLEQLREAGVDPLHLDVDVAALYNTARRSGALDAHPNCLIIDIGARTTKTLLVQDGLLKVARSIRLGTQSAMTRLTGEFQGDAAAAQRAMEDAGAVEALAQAPTSASTLEVVASVRAIEAAVAGQQEVDFLGRVLRETQRTLPVLSEEKTLTRIFLTGLGAGRTHARERIAEHYGVEVADLPTLDAVSHSLPPSEADRVAGSGAVAIGTALKVLGVDAGEIDLRREEFRFARTFDAIKVALATGATLLFFGCFLLFFTKKIELNRVREQRHALQHLMETKLRADVLDAYEKEVKDARHETDAERQHDRDEDLYFQRMKARLSEIRNQLKNELGLTTAVPPIRSCLETWSTVLAAVKAVRGQIDYLVITSEVYNQEKADVTFVLGDFKDTEPLTRELKKHTELFETVETAAPRQLPGKGIEVTVRMTLKPKEVAEPAKSEDAAAAEGPVKDAPEAQEGVKK